MREKEDGHLNLESSYSLMHDLDLMDSEIAEMEGQVFRLKDILDIAKVEITCLKRERSGALFSVLTRFDVN